MSIIASCLLRLLLQTDAPGSEARYASTCSKTTLSWSQRSTLPNWKRHASIRQHLRPRYFYLQHRRSLDASIKDFISVPPCSYRPHNIWVKTWRTREEAMRARTVGSAERLTEHTVRLQPSKLATACSSRRTSNHPSRWDRTGLLIEVKQFDQHAVRMDGSNRVALRYRKILRKFHKSAIDRIPGTAPPSSKLWTTTRTSPGNQRTHPKNANSKDANHANHATENRTSNSDRGTVNTTPQKIRRLELKPYSRSKLLKLFDQKTFRSFGNQRNSFMPTCTIQKDECPPVRLTNMPSTNAVLLPTSPAEMSDQAWEQRAVERLPRTPHNY